MPKIKFLVKLIHADVEVPKKAHPLDSGFDAVVHNFKKAWIMQGPREVVAEADSNGMIPGITTSMAMIPSDLKVDSNPVIIPEQAILNPGERLMCGLGFKGKVVGDPDKVYEIQIRPRSGKSTKKGLVVTNTPGTVDFPYTGEICVCVTNTSGQAQTVDIGEAIAQLVPAEVPMPEVVIVEELEETDRSDKGFGSSDSK